MDIENLNRNQIILLTLLTSFVTSIATGIVTVSLLEQAPPGVTQTINRVVERTVERVVPTQGAAVVTKETVVVKEDDLVTKSIEENGPRIVAIFEKTLNPSDSSPIVPFIGWGILSNDSGLITTDSGIISDSGIYVIRTSDGKSFDAKVLSQDEDVGIALMEAILGDQKYSFMPALWGDSDKLRLGQSVIIFGGKERQSVSVGIVASLTPFEQKTEGTTTEKFIGHIDASVAPISGARGAPIANIFGEIVGIGVGENGFRFVSENLIAEKISALAKKEEKKAP